MALKQQESVNVKLVGNVQVISYIRVSHVAGNKNEIVANVIFHKDDANGESFKAGSYKFTPNMDGGNFIAQAYEHLKTLPEFSSAMDC
jgi:hypothetical protein